MLPFALFEGSRKTPAPSDSVQRYSIWSAHIAERKVLFECVPRGSFRESMSAGDALGPVVRVDQVEQAFIFNC